jgi:hypothetical protein
MKNEQPTSVFLVNVTVQRGAAETIQNAVL